MRTARALPGARLVALLLLSAVVLSAGLARADDKRLSPHETVTAAIGGVKVTVTYGRPFKKQREIFGGLVPYGQVWRTGADEATTLSCDGDITLGDLKVPKGTYALFTVPNKDRWQLIVNKKAKQWGAFSYDARDDLGKTTLKVTDAKVPVEQLTIALSPAGPGALTIAWDQTLASVAISARR